MAKQKCAVDEQQMKTQQAKTTCSNSKEETAKSSEEHFLSNRVLTEPNWKFKNIDFLKVKRMHGSIQRSNKI